MDPARISEASSTPTGYTLVADARAFDRMMEALLPAARLAIDIEADSLYHYFDKVCLIQISTESRTFVLDPLAVKNLSLLGPLMADSNVEKVFHAAGYDLFCLRRDYGFTFSRLFDTYLAAQLLGYEHLGLSALMESHLNIAHSKRRQRDDWSRRPLDPEQLDYAAMDTHHLLRLRDILEEELRGRGRLPWAIEEFELSAQGEVLEREFDMEGYRRIKGSRDLSLQELAVLRQLYLLRDRYARDLDLPPFKVLNNPVLIGLARNPPGSAREMFRRPGISFRIARKYSTEIFRTIDKARREDPAQLTALPRKEWKTPSKEARLRLENLRRWRQAKAVELRLQVGVVFPGSLLEVLSACPPADAAALEGFDGMRRWRVREFGADILQALHDIPVR
jgi:ribonuclease D